MSCKSCACRAFCISAGRMSKCGGKTADAFETSASCSPRQSSLKKVAIESGHVASNVPCSFWMTVVMCGSNRAKAAQMLPDLSRADEVNDNKIIVIIKCYSLIIHIIIILIIMITISTNGEFVRPGHA